MKKLVGSVLGLILLAAVIGIGALDLGSNASTDTDTAVVTDYQAAFDVSANGDLKALETITVNFPDYKHGIFRFFDTRFPSHPKYRVFPTDIRVTMDGRYEPFTMLKQSRDRYRVAKIGSAGTTITGSHVYRISYDIKGVLIKGTSTRTQFFWDLVPAGVQNQIEKSHLTVHLPAAASDLKCAIGQGAADGTCTASGQGSQDVTVNTGALSPHTPVTISAGMNIKTPAVATLPWHNKLDPLLGQHPGALVLVLILGAVAALGGELLGRSTKEKDPGFPLLYSPPEGIGPAEAAYLLTEQVENKAFVATLMYAAESGAIEMTQADQSWTVTGSTNTEAWTKIDGVTQLAVQGLGINAPGATFTSEPNSVAAGQKLQSALNSFKGNTQAWATTNNLMVRSGFGGFSSFVVLGAGVLAIYLGAFNPENMSIAAIIPGLFAIGALDLALPGAGTKRTAAGREVWSRAGGFRRILSTDSAQERFDFSGRKDLYTSYLPWAVAFDCADVWAKKYKLETGEEPPTPHYFAGYAGFYAGSMIGSMVDSFDSSMNSSISSYQATQKSSSGGGGGFSGGGGGGGGGMGSW
ncbi:MAG: hypothetical protein JWP74_2089 [Marmoricola sp.]|nr:hypothetical protein [Marmoricola sp.]